MSVESVVQAYQAGSDAGTAVKIGDVYLGAIPEANKRGFKAESPEHKCFVHGFLDGLNAKAIRVAPARGVIIEIIR